VVKLRLNRAGRRALRRHRRLKVILVARGRSSWDNALVARRSYALRRRAR
jgi:hypothetical protein